MEKQQQNAQLQQEDALEEVREDEFEGELELSDYLLIFEVDAEWPYDKEHYCFQGKYAYPLFLTEQAIKPCFPHFNNFFEVEGVDRIKGVITIVVHNGKVDKTLEIALNESVYYDFCYATNKLKKSSLRKGRARFSFYHFDFNDVVIPGRL